MGGIVSSIFGGEEAAQASESAADTTAQAQREALDYLKETEALPQELREAALERIAGVAGLRGGTGDQQFLINQARESPLYAAIKGTGRAAEDAILRNASASGGLRSGNVKEALADQAQTLEERALLAAYDQQLEPLAGLGLLPSKASEVSRQMADIGRTMGQGEVAAAQAREDANSNFIDTAIGLGGLFF